MHFLVLKASEEKCARAFCEKNDLFYSKSIITSLIALEHLSWHSWNMYTLKNVNTKAWNFRARVQ